jgi:hypothetical protein
LKSLCKLCDASASAAWRETYPKRHALNARRWRKTNPERRLIADARYAQKHWAAIDIRDARKRGPVTDLTPAHLESIQTGACACCGARPSDFRKLHLDRIDVSLPYQQGNTAYLCRTCNTRKSALGFDALLARFERDMGRGVPIAAHDLLLALYIGRQKRKSHKR